MLTMKDIIRRWLSNFVLASPIVRITMNVRKYGIATIVFRESR